jgi:hypothetical protein
MQHTNFESLLREYDGGVGHLGLYTRSSDALSVILEASHLSLGIRMDLQSPSMLDVPPRWFPVCLRVTESNNEFVEIRDSSGAFMA